MTYMGVGHSENGAGGLGPDKASTSTIRLAVIPVPFRIAMCSLRVFHGAPLTFFACVFSTPGRRTATRETSAEKDTYTHDDRRNQHPRQGRRRCGTGRTRCGGEGPRQE